MPATLTTFEFVSNCNNLGWFALKCGLPRQKQLEGVHFVLELPASEDVCLVDFSLIYLMFCGAAY